MPVSVNQEAFTTFVKGLNTEAGALTFPKDTSVDELNCLLQKDGSRRRRLGIKYEDSHVLSAETYAEGTSTTFNTWENVGGISGKEFLVVQIGNKLRFYENSGIPISGNVVDTTLTSGSIYLVDLSVYAVSGSVTTPVSTASINGIFVVVSSAINSFYISRDPDTGAFIETLIDFRVRDYKWLGDVSEYDEFEHNSTVTEERIYDTKNCGWSDGANNVGGAALTLYNTWGSGYPPLTHPWYSGLNSDGQFSIADWAEIYAGTSRTANGHYIYNLFNMDRGARVGLPALDITFDPIEPQRFSVVKSFAGRIFYSGLSEGVNAGKIFFSQMLQETEDQIGELLQINDPTAQYLSDILDTDGGFIRIPEANNIKMLHVFGSSLLVFADNGVWSISGVDDVFRATEYTVSKISDIGMDSVGSFVSASGRPYWWSFNGIHTIRPTEAGTYIEASITENTIQSFWDAISPEQRVSVSATFNPGTNKVYWTYQRLGEVVPNKYLEVLILDEEIGSFTPWSVSEDSNSPSIIGATYLKNAGSGNVIHNVVDASGNNVVDSSGNQVVATIESRINLGASDILLVCLDPTGAVTFGRFDGSDFLDWGDQNYESYLETGYNFLGDMTTFKTAPYLTVYMERTEEGWSGNEVSGYSPIRGSSLFVSGFFDFSYSSNTSKGSQQVYRYKYPLVVNQADLNTFSYPQSIITTKMKIRGRGRSYRLRFNSEEGKDFHLLGWEIVGFKNANL